MKLYTMKWLWPCLGCLCMVFQCIEASRVDELDDVPDVFPGFRPERCEESEAQYIHKMALMTHMVYQTDEEIKNWDCKKCESDPSNIHLDDIEVFNIQGEVFAERMLMAVDHNVKEIFTVFRGDVSSFNYRYKNYDDYMNGVEETLVWAGFNNSEVKINAISIQKFDAVYPEFRDALQRYREKHKNYSLSFTGHSYGATIAILTALNTSMLNNQPSSPIRVTALLPAKFAGTSFMTYLKKYDIKVVTMIENMDEVSRMPLFKDWMYMGDLKRMVNGVLYNCKGGPFNPYCQDLYKIPDFRFTYMAFYWREIIGFHSTYKLDPHFYLSPSVIAQQVHELIVECNARFAACEAILISQIKNETPATSSLFADAMGTPPTHIDWENYIFGIKAPNQKAIVQSLKYEEIAQIVEQKMKSVKRGFFQMLANGAARSMLSFFSR